MTRRPTRVAFATSSGDAALTSDDRVCLEALAAHGIEIVPWVWDGAAPAGVDAVVLRSCWDYHRKTAAFVRWLGEIEATGVTILNPPAVLRWNMSKKYLLDLASAGVAIPWTVNIPHGSKLKLADVGLPADVTMLVVKPSVSLNGEDTFCMPVRGVAGIEARVREMAAERDVLLQAYVPEIETAGETSLVYFDGAFSHAIRKTPRAGEFRVQVEHGGSRAVVTPSRRMLEAAERALRTASRDPLLYARVDLVEVAAQEPILIELEVIDPMLFLAYDPEAGTRFAEALARRVSGA